MLNLILQISATNFLKVQFQFQNGSMWNLGHRVILYFPDNFTVMDSQDITSSGTYTYNDTYQYLQEGVKYSILLCREDNGFEITMAQLSVYQINSSFVVKVPDYILIVTLQDINTSAALSGINVGLVGASYSVTTNTSGSAKLYLSDIQTGNVTLNFSDPSYNYFVGLQDFIVKQGTQGVTYSREKCQKQQFYAKDASGPLKDVNISITNSDGAYRGWFLTGVDGTVLATWDQDNVHTITAVISKYGQTCYVPQSQAFTVSATTRQNFTLIKGICTTLTINLFDGEEQLYNVPGYIQDNLSYPNYHQYYEIINKTFAYTETKNYETLLTVGNNLQFTVNDSIGNFQDSCFLFNYTPNLTFSYFIDKIVHLSIAVQDLQRVPINNMTVLLSNGEKVRQISNSTNESGIATFNASGFNLKEQCQVLIQSNMQYIGQQRTLNPVNQNLTFLLKHQNPNNFMFILSIIVVEYEEGPAFDYSVQLCNAEMQLIAEEQTSKNGIAVFQIEEQASHVSLNNEIKVKVLKANKLQGISSLLLNQNCQLQVTIGEHLRFTALVLRNNKQVPNVNVTIYSEQQYLTSGITNSTGMLFIDIPISVFGLNKQSEFLASVDGGTNKSFTIDMQQNVTELTIDDSENRALIIGCSVGVGVVFIVAVVTTSFLVTKKLVKRKVKQHNEKVRGTMVQMSGILTTNEEDTKEARIWVKSEHKERDDDVKERVQKAQWVDVNGNDNLQNKEQKEIKEGEK